MREQGTYTDSDNNGTINASTEIVEESNYYPFGLKHKGYNNVISSNGNSVAQRFGYNGKELNEELGIDWYDFGARNYDVSLGRWMNLDPLAEKFYEHSPFVYAFNNPVNYIDPDGKAPIDPKKVIKQLNNIVESIDSSLDKAWKMSFNKNKTKVKEHGFSVFSSTVQNTDITISGVIDSEETKYEAKNFKVGNKGSVQFSYSDFKGDKGEEFIALVHTHPYSKSEEARAGESLLGAAFSGADIANMSDYGEGNSQIVEAGSMRFAMVVTDVKKAGKFFKNNSRATIQKNMRSALKAFLKAGQSWSEATINANKSVLKNSGVSLYGTTDKDKKKSKLIQE
ncbi:RHS repeat domain-containing protein [Pseudotenacibaculum haliotis]|uniref:RHS repeat domain-containing protein n=1 Tax=Pseudotenacibaculum haliotis TaxID=1862138 RepID=A0ABW5LV06_9FLAO